MSINSFNVCPGGITASSSKGCSVPCASFDLSCCFLCLLWYHQIKTMIKTHITHIGPAIAAATAIVLSPLVLPCSEPENNSTISEWLTLKESVCYTVWQVSTLSLIVLYCFTTDSLHCTRILAKIVREIHDAKITICATGIGPFMSHERASNLLLSGCVTMFPLWFYTTIQYIWHNDGHLSIIISTWPHWSF